MRDTLCVENRQQVDPTRLGRGKLLARCDVPYELEPRLEKRGKVTSIRQSDVLSLGHAVLCARHLLNNEPFAVLCQVCWCWTQSQTKALPG